MVRPSTSSNVGTRRFKGVRMRKWGKWVAEVRRPNSRGRIWLGSYDRPDEAARAYDAAVYCLRGPAAALNFPDSPPEIPSAAALSPPQIQEAAVRHARGGEAPPCGSSAARAGGGEEEGGVIGGGVYYLPHVWTF